jgi:hypothetical protein
MTGEQPNYFFIIGAMKAGTTSLFKYLADHPQVYASPRKEPRIFRDPSALARRRAAFSELFEGRTDEPWCFEASTAYTKFPRISGVPRRIAEVAPHARFVYLVRNPVERVWSHYVHNLAHGREKASFAEALTSRKQYLDISRYHMQLSQYLDVYPRDRVLVQVFEEMTQDPSATVRAIAAFLDIDTSYRPVTGDVAFNASSQKARASSPLRMARSLGIDEMLPSRVRRWMKDKGSALPAKQEGLTTDVRLRLAETLRPDVEAFFGHLGRRVPAWKDFA